MGGLTVSITDVLSLSDSMVPNPGQSLVDSLNLSDSVAILVPCKINLLDRLQLIDTVRIISPTLGFLITGDGLNLSDAVAISSTFQTAETDAVALSDSVQLSLSIPETVSDTLVLSDSVTVALSSIFVAINLSLSDSLPLMDFMSFVESGTARISLIDAFVFQDSAVAVLNTSLNAYLRRYLNDVQTPSS